MRSDFYVYVLLDPRKPGDYEYGPLKFKHEPFYVGKGKGRRDYSHFRLGNVNRDSKRIRTPYKVNKIIKILESGLEPIVVRIKNDVTEDRAFKYEIRAIQLIGRKSAGGPLTNATSGGEGTSGYKGDELHCERKGKASKRWHASLTKDELVERSLKLSIGVRNYILNCSPEELAERGRKISEAAKRRTPEDQLILQEYFREVQLNLPESVQKAKNRKVSKGLKKFYSTISPEELQRRNAKLREGHMRYWSNADEKERARRAEAIAGGYAKKSKRSLAEKNAKISSKIAEQHAKQTPYESRMRSYMVMCGVMLKNLGKGDDEVLKAKLRRRGEKFYSKPENLEHKPAVLRDKVRKLMA